MSVHQDFSIDFESLFSLAQIRPNPHSVVERLGEYIVRGFGKIAAIQRGYSMPEDVTNALEEQGRLRTSVLVRVTREIIRGDGGLVLVHPISLVEYAEAVEVPVSDVTTSIVGAAGKTGILKLNYELTDRPWYLPKKAKTEIANSLGLRTVMEDNSSYALSLIQSEFEVKKAYIRSQELLGRI